jgi:hypothetical protein
MRIDGADQSLNVLSGSNNGHWYADMGSNQVSCIGRRGISGSGTQYFKGDIAELRYYPDYHPTASAEAVESELSRWAA